MNAVLEMATVVTSIAKENAAEHTFELGEGSEHRMRRSRSEVQETDCSLREWRRQPPPHGVWGLGSIPRTGTATPNDHEDSKYVGGADNPAGDAVARDENVLGAQ